MLRMALRFPCEDRFAEKRCYRDCGSFMVSGEALKAAFARFGSLTLLLAARRA